MDLIFKVETYRPSQFLKILNPERLLILYINIYIHIGNENIYKRFKVLTKSVYKLPSAFYFYICYFVTSEQKSHFHRNGHCSNPPPPPPPPKWPLAVLRDEGGIGHCSSCVMEMVCSPHENPQKSYIIKWKSKGNG